MKRGLILEGGAMRGMFTAGVIDVMMEHGIIFDGMVGVSAGAAFGCNYKSGQIGRAIRYNTRFCRDKQYSGWRVLLKTGNMFSTEFCYGEVPLKHDVFDFESYKQNPMAFYAVCTDLETGDAVYHRWDSYDDHGFDWIRASASLPLISQTVTIDGQPLLDGGIADSIPVRFFETMGYDTNVVVLTRPKGYRKKENPAMPLIKLKYRKYPKFVEACRNRHVVYNATLDEIDEKERRGELLVIRPDKEIPVKKAEKDPDKLRLAYELGRQVAQRRFPEITAFLKLTP